MQTYFLPELTVILYTVFSVLFAIAVRSRSAWLPRFAWGSPTMRKRGDYVRMVPANAGLLHGVSTTSTNVMDVMSGDTMAFGYVVLFGLFGAWFGGAIVPALFDMQPATTINSVLLLVDAIAWAYILGQLSLSIALFALAAAIPLILVWWLLQSLPFWQYVSGAYDERLNQRLGYTGCMLRSLPGAPVHMRQAQLACDPELAEKQKKRLADAQERHDRWEKDVPGALAAQEKLLAKRRGSLPVHKLKWGEPTRLPIGWVGVYRCDSRVVRVELTLDGNETAASGLLQFFPTNPVPFDPALFGAFQAAATRSGDEVFIKGGRWIQRAEGLSPRDFRVTMERGRPALKEHGKPGCDGLELFAKRVPLPPSPVFMGRTQRP